MLICLFAILFFEPSDWQLADKAGQSIVRYEYPVGYYVAGDTFDYPIEKIWKLRKTARVWQKEESHFVDQVLSIGANILEPDTLYFERFLNVDGTVTHFRLSRHFSKIYRVQYALKKLLPDGGYIWNDIGFFLGWPDDYMRTKEIRTNYKEAQKAIKTRLKTGKRRAGEF